MLRVWGTTLTIVLALSVQSARAQFAEAQSLRLGEIPAYNPQTADDNADTEEVFYRFGRPAFYGGFNRGFYGFNRGFYGGFNRGFYGFNRGFYGGFYQPSFAFSYSRFYSPFYYPRVSFGFSYARPFYNYGFGGFGGYYCPIGLQVNSGLVESAPAPQPLQPLQQMPRVPEGNPGVPPSPLQQAPEGWTFPYDGGPNQPVPMPRTEPSLQKPTAPIQGRVVSLPASKSSTKFAYPAYGETGTTSFAKDRTRTPEYDTLPVVRR